MSSLVSAPERAASGPAGAPSGAADARRPAHALTLGLGADAALALALGIALSLLAFLTAGGTDLAPNTWTQIVLLLMGVVSACAVLVLGRPGRRWGGVTLLLFAALLTLTAVSMTWSVVPDQSWLEANRVLSYLAAFGAAVAVARLASDRWRVIVGGIAVVALALSGYALLVKVFPGTFDPQDPVGRLRAPFDYWNAIGLVGALGIAPMVWAGARTDRGRVLRGLAPAGIAVLLSVVILSYSRSALLAAVCSLGLWFAIVPLRLRGAAMLALGAVGAAAISAWALHTHALTDDNVSLSARVDAGHGFGLVLVLVLGLLVVAGIACAFAADTLVLPAPVRRRLGVALLVAVGLVPLGGVVALAASSRGLTGEVSHAWQTLTNPQAVVLNDPGRLAELSNSRPRYWSEGLKIGAHAPLHGVGAGGFPILQPRYATDHRYRVQHAHSYVIETFADLGALGLAVSFALLLSWSLAAARTFGWRPRRSPFDTPLVSASDPERIGLLTLLCVVLAFGLHATIDWTWSIPGTAVPALICAGWLAGRGPLGQRVGRREQRLRLTVAPGAAAATAVLVAVGVAAVWGVWQPLRASDADAAAVSALTRGDAAGALGDARAAVARNPLAPDPLWQLADVYSALGDPHAAHNELVKAISLQPENATTWTELGLYDVNHDQPHKALGVLRRAQQLDPLDPQIPLALARAREALAAPRRAA